MDTGMSEGPSCNGPDINMFHPELQAPSTSHSSPSSATTPSISVNELSISRLENQDVTQQSISATPEHKYTPRHSDGHHRSSTHSSSGLTGNQGDNDFSAAQQQRSNDRVVPLQQQAPYSPAALLNPKAAKRSAPPSETNSERGREETIGNGQVSLVERLHNVHERTSSPAKRVKTIEEEETKPRPKVGNFGSGSLDLKNEDNQQPQSANSAPIDLTMSDDEEVTVVKDNRMQMICIGRIKQCYVQSHQVPCQDPHKYRGNHGSQGRIKVSFRRGGLQRATNIIMVVDPMHMEFGRIDMKTAQGLAPLMDSAKTNGVMWMAVTEPRRKQPNEGGPGTPLSTLIGLTLQLYCPRKVAHDIGKYLRSKNIFLGDPVVELQKYDYFNPQNSNHFSTNEAMQPNFAAAQGAPSYAQSSNFVLRSVEEIRSDVLNMFDNIVDLENIPRRKQSQLIATPLKPHQEQALHFMVEKESEWADGDEARKGSLYKASYRSDGRKTYLHVITGEESGRKPESARGGILADEMGMGKTLSILSLVADNDSIASASVFASKAPPISVNGREQIVNSKATLIVCPLSTMVNWRNQLEEHFPRGQTLRWTYYHGSNRKDIKVAELADYDVVITTYHMLAADAKSLELRHQESPLFRINWFRIVLDEAHQIRSGNSQQAKAAYRLGCQRRWAVTGTPVQNRLEDLAALFRFLRLKPFHEATGFNTHILAPFKNADPDVVPKLQLLVSSLTLRRMKDNLDIPKRHDHIVRLKFSDDERRLHDWFERDSARQVNAATSGEKLGGKTYARILKAILYLRLICAHGRDLLGDEALKLTEGMTSENSIDLEGEIDEAPSLSRKGAFEMVELLKTNNQAVCQYTFCSNEVLNDVDSDSEDEDSDSSEETDGRQMSKKKDTYGFMTPCYHIICPKHFKKLKKSWSEEITEEGYVQCEFCDTRIRPVLFELKHSDHKAFDDERERIKKDPKLAKKMGAYTGPHTKTKVLLEELEKNRQESLANPDEPPIKSVIFSCWTTHLDLIQIALESQQHTYTRLDGRMDRKRRENALKSFTNDPNISCILVSIGAGGLGLNLTVANKVFVMEPQFNPAAEAQAVDRVHRLGQKREVVIQRFIMERSFEDKMLELQRKKKALADLTMARERSTKEQAAKQRLEDLRSLFR